MIIGAHAIVYSKDPDKDRAFLRDVLALSHVDVGGGWLIFGLPPAEIAIHPSDGSSGHELYLMCNDVEAFVTSMSHNGLECSEVEDQGWGLLTQLTLPGGGKLGVYEPRHERPDPAAVFARGTAREGKAEPRRTKSPSARRSAKSPRKATKAKQAVGVSKTAKRPAAAKKVAKKGMKKKAGKRRA
jgi:hypothetical protein